MDHLDKQSRSLNMAAVRSKDTQPELTLRKLVHGMGFRYGLHASDLPGKPDLVFRSRRCVIFMHGCYWHRHAGCSRASTPATRVEFWTKKFHVNIERDRRTKRELKRRGYRSLVVWQCDLKNPVRVARKIRTFLEQAERKEV